MKKQRKSLIIWIWWFIGAIIAATFILAGASLYFFQKQHEQTKIGQVAIAGETFTVEIADTEGKRAVGLMYREKLEPKRGMLFVFETPAIQSFWMKNTLIPLDIIFISEDRKIINFVTMPPLTEKSCQSEQPAKYVLELEAGSAEKYKLYPDQSVEIEQP